MKKYLLVLYIALSCAVAEAATVPERVEHYLLNTGIEKVDMKRAGLYYRDGVYSIPPAGWRYAPVPAPAIDADLPIEADTDAVLAAGERYCVYDGAVYRPMTPAEVTASDEAEQATKPNQLKNAENYIYAKLTDLATKISYGGDVLDRPAFQSAVRAKRQALETADNTKAVASLNGITSEIQSDIRDLENLIRKWK